MKRHHNFLIKKTSFIFTKTNGLILQYGPHHYIKPNGQHIHKGAEIRVFVASHLHSTPASSLLTLVSFPSISHFSISFLHQFVSSDIVHFSTKLILLVITLFSFFLIFINLLQFNRRSRLQIWLRKRREGRRRWLAESTPSIYTSVCMAGTISFIFMN